MDRTCRTTTNYRKERTKMFCDLKGVWGRKSKFLRHKSHADAIGTVQKNIGTVVDEKCNFLSDSL